jgi:hypothetical protein
MPRAAIPSRRGAPEVLLKLREPMTADAVTPRGGSARTLPIAVLVVGGLVLGYGLFILAPLVPTAAWSGVLDSAQLSRTAGRQFPGRDAPNTLTLFLRGAPAGRTMTLPASSSLTTESLKSGDTVHALVGWATLRESASAVSLTSRGEVLVDSTLVLRTERTQRNRFALVGAAILLTGLALVMRKPPGQASASV